MQDDERCSLEEFKGRWARVQTYLRDEGLAGLFAYSQPAEHKWSQIGHVSYLSGFDNYDRLVDTAVVVPVTGHPVVLLAGMPFMLEQMLGPNRIDDIRLVSAVDPNAVAPGGGKDGGPPSFAEETLTVLEENGIDSGGDRHRRRGQHALALFRGPSEGAGRSAHTHPGHHRTIPFRKKRKRGPAHAPRRRAERPRIQYHARSRQARNVRHRDRRRDGARRAHGGRGPRHVLDGLWTPARLGQYPAGHETSSARAGRG